MDLKEEINRNFLNCLGEHGFVQLKGSELSYVNKVESVRTLHVDVNLWTYMNAFSVDLQEVSADGKRRFMMLEQFEGLQKYSYKNEAPQDVKSAVDLAIAHLEKYGLPWLYGEGIDTPSLSRRKKAELEHEFFEHVSRARESFKRGDFKASVDNFERACAIRPLDSTNQEFLEAARKKTRIP